MTASAMHSDTALSTATVSSIGDGAQNITWAMPLDVADEVMAIVARDVQERLALGQDIDPRLVASLAPLSPAIADGYDRMVEETVGCLDIDGAETLTLTEGTIATISDNTATVLLPGEHDMVSAITTALTVLNDNGVSVDATDPDLLADVSRPRWMVLHGCSNTAHAAHSDIAAHGAATPDATLITVVEFAYS